jgi:hypothetical protein
LVNLKTTVEGSGAATSEISSFTSLPAQPTSGLRAARSEKTTSSAVTGFPSLHFAFGSSFTRSAFPSSSHAQEVASEGASVGGPFAASSRSSAMRRKRRSAIS